DRLQGDRDPQHLLPATLQVFADGGVPGRRVLVHDRDVDGRRVDARVGQQLDGLLIALGKRRIRVVTRDVRRQHRVGGVELAVQDALGQRLAIDALVERLPELLFAAELVPRVNHNEEAVGQREGDQLRGQLRIGEDAVKVRTFRRRVIQLVVLEGDVRLRRRVLEETNLATRDRRLLAVVVLVDLEDDALVVVPLDHLVRAAGNDVLRLDPLVAGRLDDVQRDRVVGPGRREKGEVRRGGFQLYAKGEIVHRLDAEILQVHLAVHDRLGVQDRVHRRQVLAEGVRVQHAPPAVDEIVRIDRRAVRPHGVLPDREGELGRVLVLLPRLGQPRDYLTGALVDAGQPFEDVKEHHQLIGAEAHTRVHRRWFARGDAHDLLIRQRPIVE